MHAYPTPCASRVAANPAPAAPEVNRPMFSKILIANRGEIACRVIKTARAMGIRTVAVYSDADAGARFVKLADEAWRLGPAPAAESYLKAELILDIARQSGAQAVHPGYGFLSENEDFAAACEAAGIAFIGPPASAIAAMGSKSAAKALMEKAGVPLVPGYHGDEQAPAFLQAQADAMGYPVLIKASAGGGGKGMRIVEKSADFEAALASCQREARASFGDDKELVEKYLTRPRHVEIQVFADSLGGCVYLFERDCSVQRRHQKVLEEAPAPHLPADTRRAMGEAAVAAARAVGYVGAGTVEFIMDVNSGQFYFMEMNTRLQVEHPVTEMITGQDLVEWQLRVASGEPLPLKQDQIEMNGWAMEARLYAESPVTGFLPSTGPLTHFRLPDDVRVDSAVEEGGEVTPHYDPMIAKLIVHAATREEAAEALADACGSVEVWPVKTNAGFLTRCASHPDFVAGDVDTGFIERRLEALIGGRAPSGVIAGIAATALVELRSRDEGPTPWSPLDDASGFRLNGAPLRRMILDHGGSTLEAELLDVDLHPEDLLVVDDDEVVVFEAGEAFSFRAPKALAGGPGGESDGSVLSPMPGKIVSVSVKAGDTVAKGQTLLVLEAMKMEHALAAPFDGVVAELTAEAGGQVSEGVVLVKLDPK